MSSNSMFRCDDSPRLPVRRRISRWLNRTLPQKPPKTPQQLPSLRRQLTNPSNDRSRCSQDQSPLFSRLPVELRRSILLSAYGNRTVHMHLSLDQPMPEHIKNNANMRESHARLTEKRNTSMPRQWLWRSCVCHRNSPRNPLQHYWWLVHCIKPDGDRCLDGDGYACSEYLGSWPVKCQIGAVAWLLACQQAYEEGIEVLYATNTFHISGDALLTRLPDYILPTRLAQMSSFELVLQLSASREDATPIQPKNPILTTTLSTLAQHTNVKRLFLCLPCPGLQFRVVDVDFTHVLAVVDTFVRTTQTESVVIQTESMALERITNNVVTVQEHLPSSVAVSYSYQLWRSLDDGERNTVIEKRQCHLPEALSPLLDPEFPELGRSRGYWILQSPRTTIMMCNMP